MSILFIIRNWYELCGRIHQKTHYEAKVVFCATGRVKTQRMGKGTRFQSQRVIGHRMLFPNALIYISPAFDSSFRVEEMRFESLRTSGRTYIPLFWRSFASWLFAVLGALAFCSTFKSHAAPACRFGCLSVAGSFKFTPSSLICSEITDSLTDLYCVLRNIFQCSPSP